MATKQFWTRDDGAGAAFAVPMPLTKPRYTTLANDDFQVWYRRNEPVLIQYWDALAKVDRDAQCGTGCDFQEFAFVQYDVECEVRAAARETTYGTRHEWAI